MRISRGRCWRSRGSRPGQYKVPVIYNWNLAIERQMATNWLVRAAYVGSHGSHLKEAIELNPAVYIPGSTRSTDQRRMFQGFQFISLASWPGIPATTRCS